MSEKCPRCGIKMKGDAPDESRYFNCNSCGGRYFLEDDGELVDPLQRRKSNARKCSNCGETLGDGEYVSPYEYGDNADGCIKCSHCGYKNYV